MTTLSETDTITTIVLLKQYRKRLEIDQQNYDFHDIMASMDRIDTKKIDGILAQLDASAESRR